MGKPADRNRSVRELRSSGLFSASEAAQLQRAADRGSAADMATLVRLVDATELATRQLIPKKSHDALKDLLLRFSGDAATSK